MNISFLFFSFIGFFFFFLVLFFHMDVINPEGFQSIFRKHHPNQLKPVFPPHVAQVDLHHLHLKARPGGTGIRHQLLCYPHIIRNIPPIRPTLRDLYPKFRLEMVTFNHNQLRLGGITQTEPKPIALFNQSGAFPPGGCVFIHGGQI